MSADPYAYQQQPGAEAYQPYEHQGAQQGTYYSKPWHITKIVMRCLNITFSVVLIALVAYLATLTAYGALVLFFGGLIACCGAALAVIWDIAEFITICARGGRKGIHPGAHVALHLLFWLCFAATTAIQCIHLFVRDEFDTYRFTRTQRSFFRDTIIPLQNAVAAFTILLLISHFVLFVRACVETARRNKRPAVIMVPVTAPTPTPNQMANGSYPSYPNQPQPAYYPYQQEKGHIADDTLSELQSPTPQDGASYSHTGQAR
ncbi:uncharacterized protein CTRU02_208028 [Colletotrichum truncatum]|uniref:Uncharacterized protein n=1 Tax=Colletotrichum truncatum TaxID=5467 RepID=A0ACC3YVC8_COLTU|nr:uncharacterized protein CTRU02_10972 [Colletotrichum truncatum]KAF6786474.1 hypothetical protein CTRU02_10972 [Colletotrichum truncatum]